MLFTPAVPGTFVHEVVELTPLNEFGSVLLSTLNRKEAVLSPPPVPLNNDELLVSLAIDTFTLTPPSFCITNGLGFIVCCIISSSLEY